MRTITRSQFNGSPEDLQARVAEFRASAAAHASTVGVPAPREEDFIEHLARTQEPFEVEPAPEPAREPSPEELDERALDEKRVAALMALEQERLERQLAQRMAEPDAPQEVKDYKAALDAQAAGGRIS